MRSPKPPPLLAGEGRGEEASLLAHARAMRHDPTPAERRLWQGLRKHCPYIADFYCPSAKLVIEVDGVSHIDAPNDGARDAWMTAVKIRVVRISNFDVLTNFEGVLVAIGRFLAPPPPDPLSQGEGEGRGHV